MERLRLAGFVRRPGAEEIRRLAAMEYMTLNDQEAEDLEAVIDRYLAFMDRLDELPRPEIPVRYTERDYLRREYKSTYFSKAINLRYRMRQEIDALLDRFDLLATPTMPMKAPRLLDRPMGIREVVERATHMGLNTYPTNVTGNPSLSVPCGLGENGLPIGLQLVGRHFDESLVLRAGHSFEQAHG